MELFYIGKYSIFYDQNNRLKTIITDYNNKLVRLLTSTNCKLCYQ